MSSISELGLLPSDQFLCSICSNIFTEPVTTPCGHSFCKSCLSLQWGESHLCQCPTCNKRFCAPPEMSTNSVLEEVSVQLKRRRVEILEVVDGSLPVDCDVCTGKALRAVKSCLDCQESYCSVHLEAHHIFPALMRHKLIDAVDNMKERVCPIHEKVLDLYCREDEVSICRLCLDRDHNMHVVVSMEEEGAQQKENIDSLMHQTQMVIAGRVDKIQEFYDSSVKRKEMAKKVNQSMDAIMDIFKRDMKKAQTKVKTSVQEKHTKYEERVEGIIKELEEDLEKLRHKHSDLEELRQKEDPLYVLQTLQRMSSLSEMKDWTDVVPCSDLCVDTVRVAVAKLVYKFHSILKILTEEEITKMKQYKESLTFDPNTAGRCIFVYYCDKRIKYHKYPTQSVPDSPLRFIPPRVFASQGFTSGRHYWEVQVGLRSNWNVGVAKETVSRDSDIIATATPGNGFYVIKKDGLTYSANCVPSKVLNLAPRPDIIGVFLDYEDGRLSFYDVNRKVHIYSFMGEKFMEKLYPYFYLYSRGKKSEPMELCTIYKCKDSFSDVFFKMEEKEKQEISPSVSREQAGPSQPVPKLD
ncbi:hypothetical protein NL108_005415 [Boleophthalmus pectinirostris]|uniref:E3 ubiquitin-protein ligase TRIM39-like n=1 Tax=Boleophthalmus pectinirostris TaxID=150288 RepID=UPI00242FCD93|nr:E3 ubiquitin-protein ligase TRIM39-like [Boleophthalmus pectinirostris]KAJ0055564.1 hypothetical protein NL108_005415 [Boleophthalmus pectinirostris]